MFYVFVVNIGHLVEVDKLDVLTQSVSTLREAISHQLDLPQERLVLLTSDGEELENGNLVAGYRCGTDTNPVHAFERGMAEIPQPLQPPIKQKMSQYNFKSRFDTALKQMSSYETLMQRVALAKDCASREIEVVNAIVGIVRDQRLQQAGWTAVMANVSRLQRGLKQRQFKVNELLEEILDRSPTDMDRLKKMPDVLDVLSSLKVPEGAWVPAASRDHGVLSGSSDADAMAGKQESRPSLLDWIAAKVQHRTADLAGVFAGCEHALKEVVNAEFPPGYKATHDDLAEHLETSDSMSRVAGLDERLHGLEAVLGTARRLSQGQSDIVVGMQRNLDRVRESDDKSMVGTLCSSHADQLKLIWKSHVKIWDFLESAMRTKQELCANLHQRLQWVSLLHRKVANCDAFLLPAVTYLTGLRLKLNVASDVSCTPELYASASLEARREMRFRQRYVAWAKKVAAEVKQVVKEEICLREQFTARVGGHIVRGLFPDMCRSVPLFAGNIAEYPADKLPAVSDADVEQLQSVCGRFKNLPEYVSLQQLEARGDFGGESSSDSTGSLQLRLSQRTEELDNYRHQLMAFESEQKRVLAELEAVNSASSDLSKKNAQLETSLEEERVSANAAKESLLSRIEAEQKRLESLEESYKKQLQAKTEHLSTVQQSHHNAVFLKTQRITALEHSLQKVEAGGQQQVKDLESLRQKKADCEAEMKAACAKQEIERGQALEELDTQHQEVLSQVRADHEAALQRLSQSSADRVSAEQLQHLESTVEELKEKLASAKGVRETALARQRSKLQSEKNLLDQNWHLDFAKLRSELDHSKSENAKRIVQLEEQLKETEHSRQLAVDKLEAEVQMLRDERMALEVDRDEQFKRFLECERDLKVAQRQTEGRRSNSDAKMTRSSSPDSLASAQVAGLRSGETSDLEKLKGERDHYKRNLKSTQASLQELHHRIVEEPEMASRARKSTIHAKVEDLQKNDTAVFVLNTERNAFIAVCMKSQYKHYLSEKCYGLFGINLKGGEADYQAPSFVIGVVIDKALCEIKKPNNRFKVPCGTRLYRVQAQPVTDLSGPTLAGAVAGPSKAATPTE